VRLAECTIEVACDVDNPLTGPRGASAIFGPQKGATPEMVQQLDANLQHFARIILRDVGADVDAVAGAGAAGGMGAAMLAFLERPAAPGLRNHCQGRGPGGRGQGRRPGGHRRRPYRPADHLWQDPVGVATVAKQFGKPVVGIAGGLGTNAHVVHDHGIDAIFSVLSRICTIEDALAEAEHNVRSAARNIAAVLAMGQGLRTGA
jgi:glycerate kinase